MSVLLVCSGGGHLKQLYSLVPRMEFGGQDRLWVTVDNGLSRSLLKDEEVLFAPYASPRMSPGMWRHVALAASTLRRRRFDFAVSTGSNLAVAWLPQARLRGTSCHFIETAARADGPSLTGKVMQRIPGIHRYTQYHRWTSEQWPYAGSVFDRFAAGPVNPAPSAPSRVVVTVGTTESYGFRRLFEKLAPMLRDADVLWQTGSTDTSGLGIEARETVPHEEMLEAIRKADVVVSHSGTGSAMSAMEQGKHPILVPRLARFGEHVDDHQIQIAGELDDRGLAISCAVEDLDEQVLLRAAAASTLVVENPPMLALRS